MDIKNSNGTINLGDNGSIIETDKVKGDQEEFANYMKEKINAYNSWITTKGIQDADKYKIYPDQRDSQYANNVPKTEEELQQEQENKEKAEWRETANKLGKQAAENEDEGGTFLGTVFNAICSLVLGIGDAVMNVTQEWMMPGSPTAVTKRDYNDWVVSIVNERMKSVLDEDAEIGQEAEVIFFCNNFKEFYNSNGTSTPNPTRQDLSVEPIPLIWYSPSAIFSNVVPALDVNFINTEEQVKNPILNDDGSANSEYVEFLKWMESDDDDEIQARVDEAVANADKQNTAANLQAIVSKWYVALRNIAIVGLLVVLVYIGIRIVIASTGEESAKYKTMLKDWAMALVLVFALHYIMIILLSITNIITKMFTPAMQFTSTYEGDDMFNYIRTMAAYNSSVKDWISMMGYTLIYVILIWYTVIFTWQYIKRVIYMAFLTIIAPLVGLTYPIDKIKDGSAQAFNMWMKEYTFNLLIQPIHLLLYTVLITSAIQLAETNFLYAIVAIGFILQAEKIIKKFFELGAKGGSGTGGFAAGAAFSSILSGLQSGSSKVTQSLGGGESSSGGGSSGEGKTSSGSLDRKADSTAPKDFSSFITSNGGKTGRVRISNNPFVNAQRSQKGNTSKNNIASIPVMGSLASGLSGITNPLSKTGTVNNINLNGGLNNNKSLKRKASNINLQDSEKSVPFSKKVISGLGRVRGRYINRNTAKKVAKLAAMGIGAGTLGMIGVSAGLASDNDGDILKYGALGLGGGALLGKEAFNQGEAITKGTMNAVDTFRQGYDGDEYNDKVLNPRLDRQWYNSEDTKKYFINKYGIDDWKDKREDALKLRKMGITDQKDIDSAIKLQKDLPELTLENAGEITKFFGSMTRDQLTDKNQRAAIEKQALSMVQGNKDAVKQIMDGGDVLCGVKTKEQVLKENKKIGVQHKKRTSKPTKKQNNS